MATSSSHIDRQLHAPVQTRDRIARLPIAKATTRTPRWRRLSPDEVSALRDLFKARDTLVLDGNPATTWRFQLTQRAPTTAVILRGVQEDAALSLIEDRFCERLGERTWSDHEEKFQPLAWTLAHHFMLESLGKLFGETLWPRVLNEAAPPSNVVPSVMLAFSGAADDGRAIRGFLRLTPGMTSRLASHAGWRPAGATVDRWAALPASLRIVLPPVQFPLSELRATTVGDVLVLGQRAQCWRALRVQRIAAHSNTVLDTWSATYDGTQLALSVPAPIHEAEMTMSQSQAETTTQENSSSAALARMPVTLEFDLGSVTLPLGELAAMKPGYVFQIAGRIDQTRVVIRAAGMRVGYGELVAVGEVLGVQVLALEPDGLR